jgi:hypothetical protein
VESVEKSVLVHFA